MKHSYFCKNIFFLKKITRKSHFLLLIAYLLSSCTSIDIYEKNVAIPGHAWKSSFKPSFSFTIKDTADPYQLFIVLRHNEKYNYNNIYVNLYVQSPGKDSIQKIQLPLTLANNEGWLGSGMDDIYEHRIQLTQQGRDFYFKNPGNYNFSIEQIMREDPLQNVLDIGLRIEKKQ
jgi:gliding motility-associated lipoprotein GldH